MTNVWLNIEVGDDGGISIGKLIVKTLSSLVLKLSR